MNGILLAVALNVSAGASLQDAFDRVAAAHKQKPRIVRNAFIEVVP